MTSMVESEGKSMYLMMASSDQLYYHKYSDDSIRDGEK